MKYSLAIRIILYVIIVFSIINGWWYIALPFALIGAWQFAFRWEIMIAGVIYDALFGMLPDMGFLGYIGTSIAVCIVVVFGVLKKIMR